MSFPMAMQCRLEIRTSRTEKASAIETGPTAGVVVLVISPLEEDHNTLQRIVNRPEGFASIESNWTLCPATSLEAALTALRDYPVAIVVSERDLGVHTWKDVLAEISNVPDPPLLIVASRLADEYLWAEALNLGAYDVLAKPFEAEEVTRVLRMAGFHKRYSREIRNRTTLTMAAAG